MRTKSQRLPLQVIRSFEQVYAMIPTLECKGLCHNSCGMVPMSAFEWGRLVIRHGKVPGIRLVDEEDGKPWCPFLNVEKRCQHYEIRPALCRLWGVVDSPLMKCPHGCAPKKYLTEEEANVILALVDRMGGGVSTGQADVILSGRSVEEYVGSNPGK